MQKKSINYDEIFLEELSFYELVGNKLKKDKIIWDLKFENIYIYIYIICIIFHIKIMNFYPISLKINIEWNNYIYIYRNINYYMYWWVISDRI